MQKLLDVEQDDFDQHKAFKLDDRLTRLKFVGKSSMTFDSDGVDAGVVYMWEVDFHVDDVVLVPMAFNNLERVAKKILELERKKIFHQWILLYFIVKSR